MPRSDSTEFGRLLVRLSPQELDKLEGMVAGAREQAEAVLEIDTLAEAAAPRCSGGERTRWARRRAGAQRRRCSGCGAT